MSNAKNIANREVCNAVIRDYSTKKPLLYVDYANTTTTEVTGESAFAYGGWGHPKRITFNGEKGGTIAFEFQVQPFQLYAIMSGADIATTATYCVRKELTCATAGELDLADLGTLDATPNVQVFAANDDCGTAIAGDVASNKFTATQAANIAVESKYIVYADITATGVERISIKGDTFPKALTIDADTIYKNEADEKIPMRLRVYKCQAQSNFTLTHSNSGDPGTLTMTCDIMEDEDGNMLDMIELEAED